MLKLDKAVEKLGLFARSDGSPEEHKKQLRKRAEVWSSLVRNGKLPTQLVWTSYTYQIRPGLKYRLGALLMTSTELSKGLGLAAYYLISSLRVVWTIKKAWRYLPPTFSGTSLHNLTT